jgi:serine/threonine protein kinase/tetratricopeptide (TPR) repeat protein
MTLTSGTKLGPYEIQSPLGAGGMGEVYRARDTRLDRTIAVKVLPDHLSSSPDAKQRFEREARTISSLNHPHICQLYDIGSQDGTDFLVMEFLEGETLADRLRKGAVPVEQCLKIGIEICEGLEKAHRSGVVHRDLKPANIFLTQDGHTKLLDFGLARICTAIPAQIASDAQTLGNELNLTSPGMALGTVAYMSPEQARGETLDERSDLFSLGVVLYEMSSGRKPFEGSTSALIFDAILNRPPQPLSEANPNFPPAFGKLLNRLMAKNSRDRCQSVRESLDVLREIDRARQGSSGSGKTRAGRRIPSIAVLPFANLSADPENQYFTDGLAEELTSALSRLHGLQVASRTSAFRFRETGADIREIGRQLNVEAVVEGSVRRAGKRLRITAQLVNVADGYHLWSERYDREITDIFEIQDEITVAIVKMLEPTLSGQQSNLTRRHSENVQAYELYLKGRRLWEKRGEGNLNAALECFRSAVELDPEYALAYSGIADCYSILGVYGSASLSVMKPRAMAAVNQAMELDSSLSEVHISAGNACQIFGARVREAHTHFCRALDIQPRSSMVHAYLCLFLAAQKRAEEAATEATSATELDPLSPFIHGLSALSLTVAGLQEDALRRARRALELETNFRLGLWALHKSLAMLGRFDEAIEVAEKLVTIARREATHVGQLGLIYGLAGRREKATDLRRELSQREETGEYITPCAYLAIDIGLKDHSSARDHLAAYIEDGGNGFGAAVMMGTLVDQLRTFPGCDELWGRLGLMQG